MPPVKNRSCGHLCRNISTSGPCLPKSASTFALKKRQSNFVSMLPEGGEATILAIDADKDLAVLGMEFSAPPPTPVPVFRYPLGHAKELNWGDFVYLFGYPSGFKMVTKGIVSSPNKDKRQGFLVDAVFGRGFSGGLCLALRDGVPNFEVVGLIKMVPARTFYVLTPGRDRQVDDLDWEMPYDGPVFLERRTEIDYGVTQAVSAEMVRSFLLEHRDQVEALGYRVGSFPGAARGS